MRLTALDWTIVAVYLAGMLAIGWRYKSFASQSLENYFLAGRKLPGWATGLAYAAAMMSADAAVAYGGLAAVTGVFVCWWYLSRFGVALFVGGVLFAVFWRRLNTFTTLEFYEIRFGGAAAHLMRLWIALRSSLIAMVAWTGITLLALCQITGPVMGLGKTATLLVSLPVALIYVFLSGYMGVVVSNAVQMGVMFLGTLVLAVRVLADFGGPSGLGAAVAANFGPGALESLPPIEHGVFPAAAALAWLAGTSIGYGGDAAPVQGAMEGQRILSSRNAREACKMYVVAAVSLFVLVWLVSVPCLVAPVLYPGLRTGDTAELARLFPNLRADEINRELAYGVLMVKYLGPGLLGLVFVAMLAAIMSTVDDNLNFGSQVLLNDVYKRYLVREASERHYFLMGKLFMFLILGLALLIVYQVKLVFNVAVFMVGLSAVDLPANWAQWWWWRFNGKARVAASFGGSAIYCLVVLGPPLLVSLKVEGARKLEVPFWWQYVISMGATTLLWVAVALLTRPEDPERLAAFYKRARPLGSWGPFRGPSDAGRGWGTIAKGLAIAVTGAAGVMCFIVALSDFYVGRHAAGGALLAAALALGFVFYRNFGPFVARLEAD